MSQCESLVFFKGSSLAYYQNSPWEARGTHRTQWGHMRNHGNRQIVARLGVAISFTTEACTPKAVRAENAHEAQPGQLRASSSVHRQFILSITSLLEGLLPGALLKHLVSLTNPRDHVALGHLAAGTAGAQVINFMASARKWAACLRQSRFTRRSPVTRRRSSLAREIGREYAPGCPVSSDACARNRQSGENWPQVCLNWV